MRVMGRREGGGAVFGVMGKMLFCSVFPIIFLPLPSVYEMK